MTTVISENEGTNCGIGFDRCSSPSKDTAPSSPKCEWEMVLRHLFGLRTPIEPSYHFLRSTTWVVTSPFAQEAAQFMLKTGLHGHIKDLKGKPHSA